MSKGWHQKPIALLDSTVGLAFTEGLSAALLRSTVVQVEAEPAELLACDVLPCSTQGFSTIYFNMKHLIERVIKVEYEPKPDLRQRIRFEEDKQIILDTGISLWQDKLNKPSIFDKAFLVTLHTDRDRIFSFTVTERFKWNNADIVGPIQILALLSKDDRRVLLASGIHDFMLDNRQHLYERFSADYPELTKDEFIHITSEAFRQTSVQQGLWKVHAWWVSGWMCLFQKTIRSKKWEF